MTEELILRLSEEALKTTAMVSAPILIATLSVGLVISVFQALTQINEATLTFVPKMIVVGLIVIFAGGWMLDTLRVYTVQLFENLPTYVRE